MIEEHLARSEPIGRDYDICIRYGIHEDNSVTIYDQWTIHVGDVYPPGFHDMDTFDTLYCGRVLEINDGERCHFYSVRKTNKPVR